MAIVLTSVQMKDIAHGVSYLHGNGVIHGDLKQVRPWLLSLTCVGSNDFPQDNIIVDHNARAIIIDFGLAMTLPEAYEIKNKAGGGRYLSTEVTRTGTKSLQTDLYAFGFLMLEVSFTALSIFTYAYYHRQITVGTTANKHPQGTQPRPFNYPNLPSSCPLWTLMEVCWGGGKAVPSISDCIMELEKMSPQDISLTS